MASLRFGLDAIASLIALATAVAAWRSATEARKATEQTRRGVQASIVSALMDQHSSGKTLAAHELLRQWVDTHGDDFAAEFKRLRDLKSTDIGSVDAARRRLAHYLRKVHRLQYYKLLDEDLIEAVMPRATAEFCLDFIEPLEAAVRSNYEKDTFAWAASRFNLPRSHLLTSGPGPSDGAV